MSQPPLIVIRGVITPAFGHPTRDHGDYLSLICHLSVTYLSLICQDAPPEQRSRQRLQQPRAMCALHAALEATAARAAAPAGSGRRGPGGWRTCRRRCGLWARRQHHARRPRRTRAARRTSSRAAASHAPRRACRGCQTARGRAVPSSAGTLCRAREVDHTHTHSVTRRQGLRHAAKCAPDFFVRGLRAAGVGRFSGPKSSALAMAAAASGVELKVPTCICVLRRGHHTRAVLLSPDLETPLLLPVFVFVWSCSAPIGVVVTAQRPIVKRATSRA